MEENYFSHPTAVIDENVQIGSGTKIWHFSHVLSGTSIGEKCSFGQNCVVGPNVFIGNRVKVQNNVSIYEGVICEDDVFLGPSMVFTNVINPRSFIERRKEFKKTLLKRGCSIGANATLVCGITVGEFALVGAGSTVTKNVEPFALVYGVPARQHGWVSKAGNKLRFDKNNIAVDEFDDSHYYLDENNAVKLYQDNYEQCS
jgi:UDP-2-acetamido-3-amino-2,3-dideoxy-glucuronate N-acetyltransferase